jgi:hypothetical protein
MEENRMPRKIFTQEQQGTRRRGRPKNGWKNVESDPSARSEEMERAGNR